MSKRQRFSKGFEASSEGKNNQRQNILIFQDLLKFERTPLYANIFKDVLINFVKESEKYNKTFRNFFLRLAPIFDFAHCSLRHVDFSKGTKQPIQQCRISSVLNLLDLQRRSFASSRNTSTHFLDMM